MADKFAVVAGGNTSDLMWATTSGGIATLSGILNSDVLIFDSNTPAGTITLDSNEQSNGLELRAGYTGTFDISGFTYNVSAAYPAFKIQAGTILMPSNSLLFKCRGMENTIGGIIDWGTGEVQTDTAPKYSLLLANQRMYRLAMVGNGTHTFLTDVTVTNTFVHKHSSSWSNNGGAGGDLYVEGDVEFRDGTTGSNGATASLIFSGSNVQTTTTPQGSGSTGGKLIFDKNGGSVNVLGDIHVVNSGVTITAQQDTNSSINWNGNSVRVVFVPVMDMKSVIFDIFRWAGSGTMSGIGVVGVREFYDNNAGSSITVEVYKDCHIREGANDFQSGLIKFVGSDDGNVEGGDTINNGSCGGMEFAKTGGTLTFEKHLLVRNDFVDSSSGGAVMDFTTKKSNIVTRSNPDWATLTQDFWDLTFWHVSSANMGNQMVRNKLEIINGISGSLITGNLSVEGDVILAGFSNSNNNKLEITMTGEKNQTLSTRATSEYPNTVFKIDKRRGTVTLITDVDINAPLGVSERILITDNTVIKLDGFNLSSPVLITQNGQIDNTSGGTLISAIVTDGSSSFRGDLNSIRTPNTFNRIGAKTRFRTRRQIERIF